MPRKIERQSIHSKNLIKTDLQYEDTREIDINCFGVLDFMGFSDPLAAPPPFVRTRVTQMGLLVANSTYYEAYKQTNFQKHIKKLNLTTRKIINK